MPFKLSWVQWQCHHGHRPQRTTANCNLHDVSFSLSFVKNLAPDEYLISSTVPTYSDTVKRYCVVAFTDSSNLLCSTTHPPFMLQYTEKCSLIVRINHVDTINSITSLHDKHSCWKVHRQGVWWLFRTQHVSRYGARLAEERR